MLVLSRRPNESILLGDDVEITVVKIDGNHVRIGIRAPKNVVVLRSELAANHTVGRPTQSNRVEELVGSA